MESSILKECTLQPHDQIRSLRQLKYVKFNRIFHETLQQKTDSHYLYTAIIIFSDALTTQIQILFDLIWW